MSLTTANIAPIVTKRANNVALLAFGDASVSDECFVRWENLENCRVFETDLDRNPNGIMKVSGVAQFYSARATSVQKVIGTGSSASCLVRAGGRFSFGLTATPYAVETIRTSIDYGIDFAEDQDAIYYHEKGAVKGSFLNFFSTRNGDIKVEVKDTGGQVEALVDGTIVFTYPNTTSVYTPGSTWFFDTAFYHHYRPVIDCKLEGTYV